jgi:hypothetical protein
MITKVLIAENEEGNPEEFVECLACQTLKKDVIGIPKSPFF